MPHDMNADRAARAVSDRDFILGPYTFRRVISAPPEVLIDFDKSDAESVDSEVIARFDRTIVTLMEPVAWITDTAEQVPAAEAWQFMRFTGDANGVLAFADMGEVIKLLLSGVVERPTVQPSGLPDGSATPTTGMPSTGTSPSEVPISAFLTPVGQSTPPTPTS